MSSLATGWRVQLVPRNGRRHLVLAVLLLVGQVWAPAAGSAQPAIEITILATGDEHGWLLPQEESSYTTGGAANLMGRLRQLEGYSPGDDDTLLLSAGDLWTGAAISSWFEGEPMVEVMGAMGYDAAAVGNHEFDYGRDVLAQRAAEAQFLFLAANVYRQGTDELALSGPPYVITTRSGVAVGVIGLSTTSTPWTTHPANVADLEFGNYETALRRFVPEMQAAGAELVVVLTHVCVSPLRTLAGRVADLDIPVMIGGHCHELDTETVGQTVIVSTGSELRSYARVDLLLDPATHEVISATPVLVRNRYVTSQGNPVDPDPEIAAIIEPWRAAVEAATGEVIGYTDTGLPQYSWKQMNWVLDAWLWAYPAAELAMSNWGGFRADVPPGEITIGSVVDVLPFENSIVDCLVTGAELISNLECCGGAVAGFTYTYREVAGRTEVQSVMLDDGTPLDPQREYHVLVNDYMAAGGSGYRFDEQDPDPFDTGLHWRQPVVDWTQAQGSDPAHPIDSLVDPYPRAIPYPGAPRHPGGRVE